MDYYDGKDCGRDLGRTESLRKDKPWAEAIQLDPSTGKLPSPPLKRLTDGLERILQGSSS
jgi:hypothetical protein